MGQNESVRTKAKRRARERATIRRRRGRLLTPEEHSLKKSLGMGSPVHEAIATAYPGITTPAQAKKKLKELEKNPFVSQDIKTSQGRYTKAIEEAAGEQAESFIANEEVGIIATNKAGGIEYRHKNQKTLDSIKQSIGLTVERTEGKNLHLHLNVIKSEKERKALLRALEKRPIADENPDS